MNVLSNQLDVESADLLLKVKAEKPNLRTLCGLTHEETELNLSYKALGPGDAKLLGPEISVIPSITSLSLAGNLLGDDGVEAFSIGLKENRSLKTLDLSDQGFGHRIGPRGATALASAIAVMTSVTSVSLLANRFDDETVAMLLKLKEEKPALTTLCGLKPNQTNVDLSFKKLGPQDAKLLAPEILVHASMTRLDVRANWRFGEEDKALLRRAIAGRSGFELLL